MWVVLIRPIIHINIDYRIVVNSCVSTKRLRYNMRSYDKLKAKIETIQ